MNLKPAVSPQALKPRTGHGPNNGGEVLEFVDLSTGSVFTMET